MKKQCYRAGVGKYGPSRFEFGIQFLYRIQYDTSIFEFRANLMNNIGSIRSHILKRRFIHRCCRIQGNDEYRRDVMDLGIAYPTSREFCRGSGGNDGCGNFSGRQVAAQRNEAGGIL